MLWRNPGQLIRDLLKVHLAPIVPDADGNPVAEFIEVRHNAFFKNINADLPAFRIHDPVLTNAGVGIFSEFQVHVMIAVGRREDFNDKSGAPYTRPFLRSCSIFTCCQGKPVETAAGQVHSLMIGIVQELVGRQNMPKIRQLIFIFTFSPESCYSSEYRYRELTAGIEKS